MSIERTAHPYIIRDTAIYDGEPIVEGTRTGVRHIILLFQSGKDPEETERRGLAQLRLHLVPPGSGMARAQRH